MRVLVTGGAGYIGSKISYDLTKPEGDIGRCADFSLAHQVLGWQPKVSLENGLHETADWIKNELNKLKL